jgi:transcriptional regulator with XRE-family HTH domain
MFNGELLKKLREERNLTQEALAEKVNVTRHAIMKYELGAQDPSIRMLCMISDALGVPPAVFLG